MKWIDNTEDNMLVTDNAQVRIDTESQPEIRMAVDGHEVVIYTFADDVICAKNDAVEYIACIVTKKVTVTSMDTYEDYAAVELELSGEYIYMFALAKNAKGSIDLAIRVFRKGEKVSVTYVNIKKPEV